MYIAAVEADEIVGGSWFAGYTTEVEVYDEPVALDGFDVAVRADEREDTEYLLFRRGLTVNGTLDLGREVHSIVVACGDLWARRVILGDAVLVVTGMVRVGEWLLGGDTQGLFEVGGRQIESGHDELFTKVHGPALALYDRSRDKFVYRADGQPRTAHDLVESSLAGMDDRYAIFDWLRERLGAGEPIFR